MNNFLTRFISAAVAVLIVVGLYYFLGAGAFQLIILFAVVVGAHELVKLLFSQDESKSNRFTFYLCVVATFVLSSLYFQYSSAIFSSIAIFFCLFSMLTQKKFDDLQHLSFFQARSIMGIFYLGLLPSFLYQILELPQGTTWLVTLLFIVFSGDIGAYLVGVQLGKHKIMPAISPKKSWEGCIGGLIFSMAAGFGASYFLPTVPTSGLIALGLVGGIVAQFGDFFESLLKRIADVKDSGKLMPGHGGVLDRVDGILFASPIIFFGATLLINYFS